jgi:formamidopyrimidine-DNA glycosylase
MPELPEVETVRRGLTPALEGRRIERAEVRRDGLRRLFPPRLAERLTGARVERLGRRAKTLLLELDTGETALVHLGMSGRMTVSGAGLGVYVHGDGAGAKHDHVVLHAEGGAVVTLNDARRFGVVDLWPTDALGEHPMLRGLGPEPLGNGFDGPALAHRLAGRRMPMKAALLDQRIVAGLGNIYVCEALHRAGVSPRRQAGRVSRARIEGLVPAIRAVLEEAIEAGGSTLRDHRTAEGAPGWFQHRFRAYGREGEPCPTDACGGRIRRIVQSGRSTFHCPSCQR